MKKLQRLHSLAHGLRWAVTRTALNRFTDFVTRTKVAQTFELSHNATHLVLSHPNPQMRSRNRTFADKEPETLKWIDGFAPDEQMWDIGANIGLYTVYAAKRGVKVVAIEPSVFNLEFLIRNINLNSIEDSVRLLPVGVGTSQVTFERLNLASGAWGDSGNSLGTTTTAAGTEGHFTYKYATPSFPLDKIASTFGISHPDHVKIDVDGIEPSIIESGTVVFSKVKSVLVEIPTSVGARERIYRSLTAAGLLLHVTARQNQIWGR